MLPHREVNAIELLWHRITFSVRPNHTPPRFKGEPCCWDLKVGTRISRDAAWSYKSPDHPYDALRNYLAFYPSRVDACFVDNEHVQSQTGDFYGGWITSSIVGPFKGGPGTSH